jgi:hypothetical protein
LVRAAYGELVRFGFTRWKLWTGLMKITKSSFTAFRSWRSIWSWQAHNQNLPVKFADICDGSHGYLSHDLRSEVILRRHCSPTPLNAFATENTVMSPTHGNPFSARESAAPTQQLAVTHSAGIPKDTEREGEQDVRRVRLNSLEQWVCELLIRNQQLRMALMEVNTKEQQR